MSYLGNSPTSGDNSFRILDDITTYTLTFDGSSSSVVSTTNYTITQINHRFVTAQRVTYTHGGGTAIGGLTSGTAYFIIKVDQNTIKLATSAVNANNNAAIDLNALGTGTSHTLNVAFDSVNTKFKATYNNGTKAQLTRAAQLQISINGVIQQPQDSITPVNGFGLENDSTIVFSTAPSSTDVFWGNVIANSYPTFDVSDNTVDTFTGTGSQTNFTLSKTPANNQNVLVTINGVVQYPSDATTSRSYSVDANVLTFTSAPSGGSIIQVRHIGFAGATSSAVTGFYGRTGNVGLTTADNVVIGTATIGVGAAGTSLLVQGNARITGILTVGSSSVTIDGSNNQVNVGTAVTITSSSFQIGSSNLHSAGIEVTNVNATGVGTFASLSVSGNVSIAGTVTYDDVTNVDSIGLVTARSGVRVDAGGLVVTSGVSTFTNSPVLIGSGTSTGTASQLLQVTGGAYVSGSVGIGTTNPTDKLSIYSAPNSLVLGAKDTTRGNHIFQLLADNASGDGELRLYKNSGSGTHEKTVEIASTGNSYFTGGNIGIGTDNPVNRFHVTQYTANTDAATFQIGSASAYTGFVNCRVGTTGAGSFIGGLYTPDGSLEGLQGSNGLIFSTSGSNLERVRITSGGNVGIGTTNPTTKLDVQSSSNDVLSIKGGTNATFMVFDNNSIDDYKIGGVNVVAPFVVYNNTDARYEMVFDGTGNVLIGSQTSTGTASQPLQVTGGAYVSGNVGIATTNPQAPLHVVGTGQTALLVSGNARITGILTVGTSSLTFDGNANTITGLSTITGSSNFSKPNLSGISSSISSTAVDVFVYDTRKDSDGGAWRKRTQNTSWYNETLNTATRGSRRDFPAVAVIVLEAYTLTIYDGDDPDMPMWMVFQFNGNTAIRALTTATATFALNGRLAACGQEAGGLSYNSGISIVSFIEEKAIWKTNAHSGIFGLPLSSRNTNGGYGNTAGTSDDGGPKILSRDCNDVAMTVLPNAPIDPSTGLPVPTIAVATAGGVSVIKDDGTVINGGDTVAIRYIHITNEYRLYYTFTSFNQTREVSSPTSWTSSGFAGNYQLLTNSFPALTSNAGTSIKTSKESYGTADGIVFHNPDPVNFPSNAIANNGMVAYATTSYNTGWMHGDIKGAFLSDTSTTSVTGTELVTNGTFDSNVTGWTVGGTASISYSSGEALVTVSSSAGHFASQQITVSPSTTYSYVWQARRGTISTLKMSVFDVTNGTDIIPTYDYNATTSMATYSLMFTTPSNCTSINVYLIRDTGAAGTAFFDNVSLRVLIEKDRSVNNKGLAVYGTITKSAVA